MAAKETVKLLLITVKMLSVLSLDLFPKKLSKYTGNSTLFYVKMLKLDFQFLRFSSQKIGVLGFNVHHMVSSVYMPLFMYLIFFPFYYLCRLWVQWRHRQVPRKIKPWVVRVKSFLVKMIWIQMILNLHNQAAHRSRGRLSEKFL